MIAHVGVPIADGRLWNAFHNCPWTKPQSGMRFSPILVIGGLTRAKLLIMRGSSATKRGKSLPITGHRRARPSRLRLWLPAQRSSRARLTSKGNSIAKASPAETNRSYTGLTLFFVHLLSEPHVRLLSGEIRHHQCLLPGQICFLRAAAHDPNPGSGYGSSHPHHGRCTKSVHQVDKWRIQV
jgi:hypothetical protein